jgi:energy-coupling factor transport system permease protein
MAFDFVIGNYCPGESVIHRLDPRVKLCLLACMTVLAFLAASYAAMAALFGLLALAAVFSRIPAAKLLKAVAPLTVLLLFPMIFNLFYTTEGEPCFELGFLLVTDVGLFRGILFSLRLFLLFAAATLLTLTTSPIAMCDGTAALLRPLERVRVPVSDISMVASIALRFIPILFDSYASVRKAQTARGARFAQGSIVARLRVIPSLMVPLFVISLRQAEDLALAMESRCYSGRERSHYHELRLTRLDAVAAAAVTACGIAIVTFRFVIF